MREGTACLPTIPRLGVRACRAAIREYRLLVQGIGGARSATSSRAAFAAAVMHWPEVVACHAMTGDMDYLLRVHVEDMEHFSRFMMETLLRHPAVMDVKSSFALQQVKETTALPLG